MTFNPFSEFAVITRPHFEQVCLNICVQSLAFICSRAANNSLFSGVLASAPKYGERGELIADGEVNEAIPRPHRPGPTSSLALQLQAL